MKQKESFILYASMRESLLSLPDAELRQILRAVFDYCCYGKEPQLTGALKAFWLALKSQFDRDAEKYDGVRQKRKEAGRLGGLKRQANANQTVANQANASNAKQTVANQAVSVTDTVLSSDNKKKSKPKETVSFVDADFFPDNLKTSEFIASWDEWETYRKEKRKTLTTSSAKKQLSMLSMLSVDQAINTINRSITQGWQGLFPNDGSITNIPGKTLDEQFNEMEKEYDQ